MADRRPGALGVLCLGAVFALLLGSAAPPARWEPPPKVAAVAPPPALQVDINTASVEELEALPGVGPVLAERIVAGRPYERVEDLDRVKGIGPATLRKLRPRVRVR